MESMSYEVLNGRIGKTGTSLCVTIPKDYAELHKLTTRHPLKKVMRDGFMVIIFSERTDHSIIELVKRIDGD